MKLYYAPQTRAIRPLIMLEELAVPYEIVLIDFKGGEHKSVEYRKIHPHGQLPALQDGTLTMFESAAICAYLADKFPDKQMAPALGTIERGMYYQWMFYSMAALDALALDRERMKECFLVLDRVLSGREYVVGDKDDGGGRDDRLGSCMARRSASSAGRLPVAGRLCEAPAREAFISARVFSAKSTA